MRPLVAAWLSRADQNDRLAACLNPDLTPPERAVAQVEGWILGVSGLICASNESTKSVTRFERGAKLRVFKAVRTPR